MDVNRTWISAPVRTVVGEVWHFIRDDSALSFAEYEPRIDEDSRWYITSDNGGITGAFWMRRHNHVTWEFHANVRPKFWGNGQGTEIGRAALEYAIHDTGAKKVIASVPTSCPQVITGIEKLGFEREGVSANSWQRDGKLYDVVYYGITRT